MAVIPALGGGMRLVDLAGNPVVTEANARFVAAPTPVVAHIVSATAFLGMGAFQFTSRRSAPGMRRHRRIGILAWPCGVVAAFTGLWMTLTYPWPDPDGLALYLVRLVFGSAMTLSLGAAAVALRRGNGAAHGAWMTRSYAIGAGAGTQALLLLPPTIAFGAPGEMLRTSLMTLGWVLNIAVAEGVIRARRRRRLTSAAAHPRALVRGRHESRRGVATASPSAHSSGPPSRSE
ncbi:MAG: DUF2306 domain-containing protein [Mobilicoccus sp.]|nr:DUF2306 domain-containing protein [Mobilicoccus sp.]